MQLDTWRDAGLPQSRTAVENALIMEHSSQWCLLVDPQVCCAWLFPAQQLAAAAAQADCTLLAALGQPDTLFLVGELLHSERSRAASHHVCALSQELGNAYLRGYFGGDVRFAASSMGPQAPSPLARGQLFVTVDQSDPQFKDVILRAIETGAVLLLENLDEDMDDIIEQASALWWPGRWVPRLYVRALACLPLACREGKHHVAPSGREALSRGPLPMAASAAAGSAAGHVPQPARRALHQAGRVERRVQPALPHVRHHAAARAQVPLQRGAAALRLQLQHHAGAGAAGVRRHLCGCSEVPMHLI